MFWNKKSQINTYIFNFEHLWIIVSFMSHDMNLLGFSYPKIAEANTYSRDAFFSKVEKKIRGTP